MNWGGKIIGGALGMLTLGPLGAAIGAFIGHQFDAGSRLGTVRGALGYGADPSRVNALFFPMTFRVMGRVAKADGRVSSQEIASARAVMHALHLTAEQMRAAIGFFYEGKEPGFDLDAALGQLRAALAPYPNLAQFFIEIQMQAALAGNGLSELPRAQLRRVASGLGLSATDFARLESALRWSQAHASGAGDGAGSRGAGGAATAVRLEQAYGLLEASVSMSDEQVVKAYRRQMSRHHPDKLKANGLPESMLERAKERTQRIQAAYELIRARRGMR